MSHNPAIIALLIMVTIIAFMSSALAADGSQGALWSKTYGDYNVPAGYEDVRQEP